MININRETSVDKLYHKLLSSIDPNIAGGIPQEIQRDLAQFAVNVIDFIDDDDINGDGFLDANCVTTFVDPCGFIHYGFDAQPFITEIAMKISPSPEKGGNYFAVELYNPFNTIIDLSDFVLELVSSTDPCNILPPIGFVSGVDTIGPNGYFVIANDLRAFRIWNGDRKLKLHPGLTFFGRWIPPDKGKPVKDLRPIPDKSKPPIYIGWESTYSLFLRRRVVDVNSPPIYVDRQIIDPYWTRLGKERHFGRYDRDWHVVYQTMELVPFTLGMGNNIDPGLFTSRGHNFSFFLPNPIRLTNPVRPRAKFITVGDIPRILTIGSGITPYSTIGQKLMETHRNEEHRIRLDLQNRYHRNVFQYLTVFDPTSDNIDNDGDGTGVGAIDSDELKIPGRININTAPWYVIAQLPWVSPHTPNYELARAIVEHRDAVGAFGSIGELNFVGIADPCSFRSIDYYARTDGPQAGDLLGFPDLTFGDGIADDFEERDVIFSRISNLVTVRSDVFTAYILVRIGADGPQKRVIAILDRSNVYSGGDKVRTVALHYVPDPR